MGHSSSKPKDKDIESDGKKSKARRFGFKKKKQKLKNLKVPDVAVNFQDAALSFQHNDDIEAKKKMQDQLAFNSDIFVLNQMMMSVEFFANYERDLCEAIELNRRKESQKTQSIIKHCKTTLLPDRLAEAVDRRVKYVAKHGKFKSQLLPLHTQTLYIVHDNIEITNPGEMSEYSVVTDAPLYKFQIDDPYEGVRRKKVLHHSGFIKLKSFEKISKTDMLSYSLSSDSQYVSGSLKNEDIDEGTYGDVDEEDYSEAPQVFNRGKLRDSITYSKNVNNIYEKKLGYYTSSMNSLSPSSSEYDYTYIRALHTHQPLSIIRRSRLMEKPLSTVMLPDTCITTVSRFMINNIQQEQFYRFSADDEENSDEKLGNDEASDGNESSRDSYYYEDKQYLNSKGFLAYFIDLFQQSLAKDLGISDEILQNATWMGSSVYCAPWEIIPALSCPWPREANEWIYRKRETRIDPSTNELIQWPSQEMINKIINFGCHVIPQGYTPKSGTNPQRELEWKIVFPEADRYLESRLSPAHVKVYMMTKALFKAFIEPCIERGLNMFTSEHIRNHLFWQCEYNYTAWSNDQLGEGLLKFLGTLLQCIKTHRLPDYFMPKRNLLENIPEKVLVDIHRRIYRIVESPIPYVLIAIRNLRYQRDFYPKLKYKKLYSRLMIDNPENILNPRSSVNINDLVHAPSDDDEEKEAPLGSIAYFDRKERRSRRKRARCVRFALDDNYVTAYVRKKEVEKDARRDSIESIDTKVKAIFLKHMEILRRKLVYVLFIEQFIDMCQTAIKYQTYNQSMDLLRQSERLCSLLSDDKFNEDAQRFRVKINELRESVEMSKRECVQGPELPRRLSTVDIENRFAERYRLREIVEENGLDVTDNREEATQSDDDNDEIYSYHKSIIAQIHASSTENLARFQHNEDADDDELVGEKMTSNEDASENL